MKVILNNVRLSFPHIFEPSAMGDSGDLRFSASFIFDPSHPARQQLEDAIATVAKDKWGEKAGATLKALRMTPDKICLRDGNTKTYDGYKDQLFVSTSNKLRPTVVDRDRTPLVAADGRPYAGCYVNASIEIWAMDNHYGKRISATLGGVQFFRDGEAFSAGGVAKPDDFENYGVDQPEAEDVTALVYGAAA
jgi:hypothetical protein